MKRKEEGESKFPNSVSITLPGEQIDGTAAQLLLRAGEPVADEVGAIFGNAIGILGDIIKLKRQENLAKILHKTRKRLKDDGIDIDNVKNIKTEDLSLFIENASLSPDEIIQDLWSGLLSESLNPNKEKTRIRLHIELLKQITADDALILQYLYEVELINARIDQLKQEVYRENKLDTGDFDNEHASLTSYVKKRADELGLYDKNAKSRKENLFRLGLIKNNFEFPHEPQLRITGFDERSLHSIIDKFAKKLAIQDQKIQYVENGDSAIMKTGIFGNLELTIRLTDFGRELMCSCGVPIPNPNS